MADKIGVKIIGGAEVRRKIKELEKKHADKMEKALIEAVILVEGRAKEKAPVDTGRLRASITHEVRKVFGGWVANVGSNVTYAPHQEFGTSKMNAQPYLIPALKESLTDILEIFRRALGQI